MIPTTLFGRVSTDGREIQVWCPHCRDWHLHSWIPGGTEPDHRVAHCFNEDSPFDETGYMIAPFSEGRT